MADVCKETGAHLAHLGLKLDTLILRKHVHSQSYDAPA
jgi:hypothetical protein